MTKALLPEFPHFPPKGYSYEFQEFNTRLIGIWLRCHHQFDYNLGKSTATIWGFYSPKKREYYAPINSIKCGSKVRIEDTTSYSAMQLKQTVLEKCFV